MPLGGPTLVPTLAPTMSPTSAPSECVCICTCTNSNDFPSPEITDSPAQEPTATPTTVPTATPTAEPTATPHAEPTAIPTAEPSATPTAIPTATATAEPTAVPTATPTYAPTQCYPATFDYTGLPASTGPSAISCASAPNCMSVKSTAGTHSASVETCGYTTTMTATVASSSSAPNPLVSVNDVPSSKYGYMDQGLGLCSYIPVGSLPYQGKAQNPYKITNYDNNHIDASYHNKVNFIQVHVTTAPNVEFNVTGDEGFGNEYFAVYCSSKKGALGKLNSNSSNFNTWLSLSLPLDGTFDYASFTPYTYINGAPNNYCAHTAILVNFKVPCTAQAPISLNTPADPATTSASSDGSKTSNNNNTTMIAVICVVVGVAVLGSVAAYAFFVSSAAKAVEIIPAAASATTV